MKSWNDDLQENFDMIDKGMILRHERMILYT